MKIGIEGQRLFRQKKHGMDMVALELIRNLQQLDQQNEYFIYVKDDEDSSCIKATHNFNIRIIGGGPYPVWEQYALPRAARADGVDMLHCTSNTAPVYTDIPIIVTLHDIIYMESNPLLTRGGTIYQKAGNLYRRFIVPKVVHKAQRVITVSNFEKQRIADFFNLHDNRLCAIYNGVSEHFVPVTDTQRLQEVRQRYHLPEEFFFFLGNTDPKKNTGGVLKAYSRYIELTGNKIPLVMPDYDKDSLIKLAKQTDTEHVLPLIHLTGYIINTDLPVIYSLCTLFLYPSLRESFGIPMLEAMRCGAPVITSNTSSMPEISGDGALIINPHNPKTITEGMLKILQNSGYCDELIEKGKQQATKFSWINMTQDVLALYHSVYDELNH